MNLKKSEQKESDELNKHSGLCSEASLRTFEWKDLGRGEMSHSTSRWKTNSGKWRYIYIYMYNIAQRGFFDPIVVRDPPKRKWTPENKGAERKPPDSPRKTQQFVAFSVYRPFRK